MPKNISLNAYFKCQQAVVDKIGIENLSKTIRIGIKIKKIFSNGYELIDYLYKFGQRQKFLWLETSNYELDVDVEKVVRWKM